LVTSHNPSKVHRFNQIPSSRIGDKNNENAQEKKGKEIYCLHKNLNSFCGSISVLGLMENV
jgi:hypothetical protein